MNDRKTESWMGSIFFYILFLLCLLNIFYFPYRIIDRFFTSGRLWLLIVVSSFFCFYLIFFYRRISLPRIVIYAGFGMLYSLFVPWGYGVVEWQQVAWLTGLFLILFLISNQPFLPVWRTIYFIFSLFGIAEALLGIGQYLKIYEVFNSQFPVTGTFDNPAGLSAYLVMSFPFALFFLFSGTWGWRIWGFVASVIIAGVVIGSHSRAGILAVVIIGGFYIYQRLQLLKYCRLIILPGILCVLILLGGLYLWKKNSATGRLFIWRSTVDLIRAEPLVGGGPQAFGAGYMLCQANYLKEHQESQFALLADNVKHPFNEYLDLLVKYGVVGLLFFLIMLVHLLRLYGKSQPVHLPLFLSLLAVGIVAFFSYPLSYPSVCLFVVFNLAFIARTDRSVVIKGAFTRMGFRMTALAGGSLLLGYAVCWKQKEVEWYKLAHRPSSGREFEMTEDYRKIYPFMIHDALFLYNYAATLNEMQRYRESADVLGECLHYMNDADVQLLLADNYMNQEEYGLAEKCLLLAVNMCPNRFLPLYRLVDIYDRTGRREEASCIARIIINKKAKIPSYAVEKMKKGMAEYLSKMAI